MGETEQKSLRTNGSALWRRHPFMLGWSEHCRRQQPRKGAGKSYWDIRERGVWKSSLGGSPITPTSNKTKTNQSRQSLGYLSDMVFYFMHRTPIGTWNSCYMLPSCTQNGKNTCYNKGKADSLQTRAFEIFGQLWRESKEAELCHSTSLKLKLRPWFIAVGRRERQR